MFNSLYCLAGHFCILAHYKSPYIVIIIIIIIIIIMHCGMRAVYAPV